MTTSTNQAKLMIKARAGLLRVYENGEEVATIEGGREWFGGRPIVHCFSIVLKDGRILSLPHYSYMADVKKDIRSLLENARHEAT